MKNYRNDITCCLECLSPLEEKYPKEGQYVTCKICGAIHAIDLVYVLRNTGGFN